MREQDLDRFVVFGQLPNESYERERESEIELFEIDVDDQLQKISAIGHGVLVLEGVRDNVGEAIEVGAGDRRKALFIEKDDETVDETLFGHRIDQRRFFAERRENAAEKGEQLSVARSCMLEHGTERVLDVLEVGLSFGQFADQIQEQKIRTEKNIVVLSERKDLNQGGQKTVVDHGQPVGVRLKSVRVVSSQQLEHSTAGDTLLLFDREKEFEDELPHVVLSRWQRQIEQVAKGALVLR